MASAIASRRDTLATVGLIIDTYLDAVRLRAMFPRLLLAGAVKDEVSGAFLVGKRAFR
jgi:hypothetical protein